MEETEEILYLVLLLPKVVVVVHHHQHQQITGLMVAQVEVLVEMGVLVVPVSLVRALMVVLAPQHQVLTEVVEEVVLVVLGQAEKVLMERMEGQEFHLQ
jgi:hypothetical protein